MELAGLWAEKPDVLTGLGCGGPIGFPGLCDDRRTAPFGLGTDMDAWNGLPSIVWVRLMDMPEKLSAGLPV